ncbi:hypothetical protein [Thermoleptolyngbya sp. C42_A2020_037]|uniref:hypothetical protein n=1 Tax=Thermoleptolyngbya sp. C42_A2020_037 TaxID=2747799 RepID=UPI0019DBCAEE|nr:hypothetical protein [Thermoleptolyngbya sp. C42_A2020_037]MBF2087112.1 hypothetical protein [Thermoleptolyngbya sp. C42_A2020_037]
MKSFSSSVSAIAPDCQQLSKSIEPVYRENSFTRYFDSTVKKPATNSSQLQSTLRELLNSFIDPAVALPKLEIRAIPTAELLSQNRFGQSDQDFSEKFIISYRMLREIGGWN